VTWSRRLAFIAAAGAVAASLAFSPAADPGVTTLQRTILDLNGDGRLEYAAGEPPTVRTELGAAAQAGREARRRALLSLVGFTDFQLADEESVARGPWADKCGQVPTKSAFRPQEAMVPHLINSNIRAANAIAAGPVTGRPFDFGIQLGDAADNTQRNEVRWFIDLLDGGLIDPDSGDPERYEGPQGREPWPSPTGRAILELANDPFFAPGLRRADGSQIPWYSVLGNHDAKIQGTVTNLPGWWDFVNVYSQGPVFIRDLAPDHQQELCANPALIGDPAFWMQVLSRPGTTSIVTADAARATLTRRQWMAEHLPPAAARAIDSGARGSTGVPAGHGYLNNPQCTDAAGKPLDRLCYSYDAQGIHFVVIDTNADEGLQNGNIDEAQMDWLERDLIAHSSRYYEAGGALASTSHGRNSLIVVFSHHTRDTMSEDFPVKLKTTDYPPTARLDQSGRALGAEFEALLHRFPNVILHGAGHTHENRVWARPGRKADEAKSLPGTGYWEVNSSSHADWPMQSRTIEIVDNRDGTLSIFGILFDATAPARACKTKTETDCIAWSHDATNESALGAPAKINEEYLAAVAREVGWNDPQEGAALGGEQRGRDNGDRNVELLVMNPIGFTAAGTKSPPPGGTQSPRGVRSIPEFGNDALRRGIPGTQPQTSAFDRTMPGNYGGTQKGLGEPAAAGRVSSRSIRGGVMMLVAVLVFGWVYRVRVRGWMIGLSGR
jgi:metallophosphoesterase (TIGR03767 family)